MYNKEEKKNKNVLGKELKLLAVPERTLTKRVIKGSFWNLLLRFSNSGLGLLRTIVLVRLISPHDFGLFGIAMLALSIVDTFSETGFNQALIKKKGDIGSFLDSVWTVQVTRGFVIAIVLFFASSYVADFFDTEQAEPILKMIGLAIIFKNLANVSVVYFEKELKFNKFFVYQFSGTFIDVTVAVTLGILTQSVWALVFGFIAGHFVRMVTSYFIDSYRPKIKFDWRKIRDLSVFGKWVFGSSLLNFLLTQGDDILVGKVLGATSLGFYQIAYRVSNFPANQISNVISQVLFPAYSKLQDQIDKLREAYLKVMQIVLFVSLPVSGFTLVFASDFTRIVLGDNWMPLVPALQVLAIYGGLRALGATTGALFLALGKPQIQTTIKGLQLILLVILIYPLTIRYGILGASIAVTSYAIIFNIVAVYIALKLVNSSLLYSIKMIVPSLVGIILSIFIIGIYKSLLPISGLLSLVSAGLFAFTAYLLVFYIFDKFLKFNTIALILEQINSFNNLPAKFRN